MSDQTAIDPPKKKGGLVKTLMLVIGAGALGAGAFGAGIFYADQQISPSEEVLRLIERDSLVAAAEDDTPQRQIREVPAESLFETSYYEFPAPLTTNLNGSRRFLQVSVGLSTTYDAQVVANVERHAMAIRSDILAVISSFTETEVEGTEGRQRLSDAMRDAINARLLQLEGFGGVEDVFFPSFVLQ